MATAALTKQQQAERTAAAATVREGIELQKRGCLLAGEGLIRGAATFTGDDQAGFREWAQEVSRKPWKTCESYIAVAKAHSTLTTKADRTKAAGLTFELQQVLASTPVDERKTFLQKVTPTTTPEAAREIRDELKESKLSPKEKSEREKARKEREKQTKADKTQAAKESVAAFLKGKQLAKMTPEQLMLVGVLVGAAHGPDNGADGVRAYFIAKQQVQDQLQKRDAEVAAAATAS